MSERIRSALSHIPADDRERQMKICKTCGAADRYANGRCRPCRKKTRSENQNEKESAAAYRKKNREELNAMAVAYRVANPDKRKEIKAKSYQRNKEHAQAYYSANKDKITAQQALRHAKNPKIRTAYKAGYYAKNSDAIKEKSKKWAAENPELRRIQDQNRRARKTSSGGKLSNGLHAKLLKLQRGKCAYCKASLCDSGYHLDHHMPLALGGEHIDKNMQLLCPTCNMQKNAKHPIEFMQSKGFLL